MEKMDSKKRQSYGTLQIEPIGIIHSCFTEKFGIPRQPGMVKSSSAILELFPVYNREEMLRSIDQFSHIWVHFQFHQTVAEGWKPTVRPPWLGGKKRVGVFATRSPHRPNHLGMSAVRLEGVVRGKGKFLLELSGIDFLDETPVIDIKPYIPYSDSISSATCGYARGQQPDIKVVLSAKAEDFCRIYQLETGRILLPLIKELLGQDPRPASQKKNRSEFGMQLWDVNIRWRVEDDYFFVKECEQLTDFLRE